MSISSSSRPTAPATPATRQLLDELDALMQRMLALPVNQHEDGPSVSSEESTSSTLVMQTQALRELAPGSEPGPGSAYRREQGLLLPEEQELQKAPPDILPAPILRSVTTIRVPEEEKPAEPVRPEAVTIDNELPASPEVLAALGLSLPVPSEITDSSEPSVLPVRKVSRGEIASAAARPFPGWLAPLIWSNRVFDYGTICLGPLGRWLRGASGRSLLGWIGLGLLAGALGWLLSNEIGWNW